MSNRAHVYAAILCLFVLPWQLGAQTGSASIRGGVLDPAGRSIAGAQVTLKRLETGAERRTITNWSGAYQFAGLPAGTYALAVTHSGFQQASSRNLELHTDAVLVMDLTLQIGAGSESVDVIAEASALETQSTASSRVVTQSEVESLPLNGRQLQNLALLAPGVAAGWNWSTAANRYGKARENLEGAFVVNGARGRSNNFQLDGMPMNLRQYGVINFEPSVEAVQEFRLITGTPPAEYGTTMGSTVSIVTRGGGERYHGALYEFFRNDRLDANDTFNRRAGLPPGKLRQNQFGGSLGGPLFSRSHFFFVNTEFLRIVEGVETRVISVPAREEAAGLLRYRDADGNERKLDLSGRMNPLSRRLLSFYPEPNAPGQGELNHNSSLLIRLNDYQVHSRTDHYLGPRDQLNVRFSWNLNDQLYVINRFGGPFIPGFSLPNPEKTANGGMTWSRAFSGRLVSELRLGINRYRNPLANGDTTSSEQIGLPGGDGTANGIPSIEFRGGALEGLGGQPWLNREQNELTWFVSDTLS